MKIKENKKNYFKQFFFSALPFLWLEMLIFFCACFIILFHFLCQLFFKYLFTFFFCHLPRCCLSLTLTYLGMDSFTLGSQIYLHTKNPLNWARFYLCFFVFVFVNSLFYFSWWKLIRFRIFLRFFFNFFLVGSLLNDFGCGCKIFSAFGENAVCEKMCFFVKLKKLMCHWFLSKIHFKSHF